MNSVNQGDKVTIRNNSIFQMMGFNMVTGTVFHINPTNRSFSIRCDQTKAIEIVDEGDGDIEVAA